MTTAASVSKRSQKRRSAQEAASLSAWDLAILRAGREVETVDRFEQAERYFVEGEDRLVRGKVVCRWPTIGEVASECGVRTAHLWQICQDRNWWEKRYEFQRRGKVILSLQINIPRAIEVQPPSDRIEEKEETPPEPDPESSPHVLDSVGTNTGVLPQMEPPPSPPPPASPPVVDANLSPLAVCEEVIRRFDEALKRDAASVMRPDAVTAFDKAVRLRAFLLGDGEKGKGQQPMTLDELQERYTSARSRGAALDEAATDELDGVIAEADPLAETEEAT